MTNNNSKPASTEEQQRVINELLSDREMQARIVASLQQKNEQLTRELNQVRQELGGIKTAVLQNPQNPQLAIQMSHAGIQQAIDTQRMEHEASNQRKALEREEALAKQLEQDKQAVFSKYPNMVTRLEKDIASEKQKIQARIKGVERFYSLDKSELTDFLEAITRTSKAHVNIFCQTTPTKTVAARNVNTIGVISAGHNSDGTY